MARGQRRERMIGDDFRILYACEGGMGVVYVCEDRETHEKLALKTFKPEYQLSKKVIDMFMEEARIWVSLGYHDHIVWARKADIIGDKPYIILEFAGGWNLRAWMQQRKFSLKQYYNIALKIAAGMKHAQEKVPTIVHRDLKPENVMLRVWKNVDLNIDQVIDIMEKHGGELHAIEGEEAKTQTIAELAGKKIVEKITNVKVTDFGLAQALVGFDADIDTDSSNSPCSPIVVKGRVGTPPYMSPEQCLGKPLDCRSDIYSYGVILYEMITRHWPYSARNARDLIRCHVEKPPLALKPAIKNVPEGLTQIVMRCLEKSPDDRYQSFADLKKELDMLAESYIDGPHTKTIYSSEGMSQTGADELIAKGTSLISLGKLDEGLKYIEQAVELKPNDTHILNEASNVLYRMGFLYLALSFCKKALAIEPDNVYALNDKAMVLTDLNRVSEALSCFNRILEIDPTSIKVLVNKGKVLCDGLGEPEKALECFEQAIELDPDLTTAQLNRGIALRNLGRFNEAVRCWQEILENDPNNVRAMLQLGALLIDVFHRSEEALELFEQAIRINPNSAEAWHDRGVALEAMGQLRNALSSYERALGIDSKFLLSLFNKGSILTRLGNFKLALKCFDKVLELDPNDSEASRNRQVCEAMLRRS